MRMWVYNPHTGGKKVPPAAQARTERRILDYANNAYTEPDVPRGRVSPGGESREEWIERLRNTPTHLCRIRYFGNEDRWSFAF